MDTKEYKNFYAGRTRQPVERKEFFRDGVWHRECGPALECSDGSEAWYFQGKFHREDGPAISDPPGYKAWFVHGEKVRVEFPSGVVFTK